MCDVHYCWFKNGADFKNVHPADAPWCEIRRSHASFPGVRTHFSAVPKERYQAALDSEAAAAAVSASAAPSVPAVSRLVKGRSEPCQIVQVAEALASARGCSLGELSDAAYANTIRLFFPAAP